MSRYEVIPLPSERAREVLGESIRRGWRQMRRTRPPSAKPHIRPKSSSPTTKEAHRG